MKLQNKLLFSQIIAFSILFLIFILLLPQIVYFSVYKADREETISFSNQIMTNIDQCIMDAERFSKVVADDDDLCKLIQAYMENPSNANSSKISLYLSNMGVQDYMPSYRVLGIQVNIENHDKTVFSTVGLSESIQKHINESALQIYHAKNYTQMIIDPFRYEGDSKTVFGNQFDMLYGYITQYKKGNITGTVTIIASYDEIYYIAQGIESYCNDFKLMNGDNKIVPPVIQDSGIEVEQTLENMVYGTTFSEGYYDDGKGFSTVTYSKVGNWKLICRLTKEDIIDKNQTLIMMDAFIIASFAILGTAIMISLIRKFLLPLREVSEQMGKLAKGDLDVQLKIRSKDEVGEVAATFNYMAEQISQHIHTLLEKEKLEQKMRYSILISQVDPHFIYNTMNTITYLAQQERNKDVIAANKAMIEILKDRLRIEVSDVYDTIEQEINVVSQYLLIQNYRYEGTFKTKIEVQEEMNKCYIAKNILQPLVENALNHGILNNKDEDGEILGGCIRIEITNVDDSNIQIIVSDNGAGMTPEVLERITSQEHVPIRGKHIGIRNIRGRIEYLYGNKAELSIESIEEQGTTITLILPWMRKENS